MKSGYRGRTKLSCFIYSGYAVHSTIYHMLCLATYNHFAWHGTTIYGLLHQTVEA